MLHCQVFILNHQVFLLITFTDQPLQAAAIYKTEAALGKARTRVAKALPQDPPQGQGGDLLDLDVMDSCHELSYAFM